MQPQEAAFLNESCRQKYALGTERLQQGDDALALLSTHGALEDGLRAYLAAQGVQVAGDWPALLDTLRTDKRKPMSTEEAERLRRINSLRNRVAHGETVKLDRAGITSYHQFAGHMLHRYGIALNTEAAASGPRSSRPARPASPGMPRLADQFARYQRALLPVAIVLVLLAVGWVASRSLTGRPGVQVLDSEAGRTPLAQTAAPLAPGAPPPEVAAPIEAPPLAAAQPGALAAGGRALVSVEGDQLNLRSEPGQGANSLVLSRLDNNTSVEVISGPGQSNGRDWWQVRVGDQQGWCAGDFLIVQAGP